jgi:predicted DNA-binding transcriptional regulator YafY
MNRVERLTATLLLLQEKPRTAAEIAAAFEISRRTVLRDIQALSEMGVPVIAREGPGGGYWLPESYSLDPLALSTNESFCCCWPSRGLRG